MKMTSSCQNKAVVAAFDFDGTLTTRDSLVPFLHYALGKKALVKGLLQLVPSFTSYLMGQSSRQSVKEAILTKFLANIALETVEEWGRAFAAQRLDDLLRPAAMQRLQWHQNQGHCCLIISAAIDPYLLPWGERHGCAAVIASQLQTDGQGALTGQLLGVNCWGPEKVKRLEKYLNRRQDYLLYAYGDSQGDADLLAYADKPFYRRFS